MAALAAEAAKEARYSAAACLIELAKDVADLTSKANGQLEIPAKALGQQHIGTSPPPSTTFVAKPPTPLANKTRPKKADYPKFLREGNSLVKLGWSPSEKSEYEHKSPKEVLPLLLAAISKVGAHGRRFSMDKVLPLVNPADNGRIPDYQSYLCLAWLKALGLLAQQGRKGYSLTTRAPIEPLVETHWAALPSR